MILKNLIKPLKGLGFMLFAVMAGFLGARLESICFQRNLIYRLDVNRLTQDFIQQNAQQKLSKEALSQKSQAFSQNLDRQIKARLKKRQVILIKEAVVTGAVDLTPLFRLELGLETTQKD